MRLLETDINTLLSDLESNSKYDFLRASGEFWHLIRQHQAYAKQDSDIKRK